MRRREFITLLGSAFAIVPGAAIAQTDRIRLVGLLLSQFEGSQEAKDRIAAVREGLQKLGWTEGHNIRIEAHYANGSADRMRAQAAELCSWVQMCLWPLYGIIGGFAKGDQNHPHRVRSGNRSGMGRLR